MVDLHNYNSTKDMWLYGLGLDLQDGGIMVQDGQNDFVHVLPQTQVNLLLLLQSIDQLRDTEGEEFFKICSAVLFRASAITDLIPGSVVNLSCQTLSFSFDRKTGLV